MALYVVNLYLLPWQVLSHADSGPWLETVSQSVYMYKEVKVSLFNTDFFLGIKLKSYNCLKIWLMIKFWKSWQWFILANQLIGIQSCVDLEILSGGGGWGWVRGIILLVFFPRGLRGIYRNFTKWILITDFDFSAMCLMDSFFGFCKEIYLFWQLLPMSVSFPSAEQPRNKLQISGAHAQWSSQCRPKNWEGMLRLNE